MGETTPSIEIENSSVPDINEQVLIKVIEQNLHGVMFHNFKSDYYDVLELRGFRKMHLFQYEEEGKSLRDLKHKYILDYCKMPCLDFEKINYWKEYDVSHLNPTKDNIPELVKQGLKKYVDWETTVLENLLKWKRMTSDKSYIQYLIKDVMSEIDRIETIINILEEHDYNYDCICELSNYLEKKFREA